MLSLILPCRLNISLWQNTMMALRLCHYYTWFIFLPLSEKRMSFNFKYHATTLFNLCQLEKCSNSWFVGFPLSFSFPLSLVPKLNTVVLLFTSGSSWASERDSMGFEAIPLLSSTETLVPGSVLCTWPMCLHSHLLMPCQLGSVWFQCTSILIHLCCPLWERFYLPQKCEILFAHLLYISIQIDCQS